MPTPPGFASCSARFVLAAFNRPAFITWGVDNTDTDPASLSVQMLNCLTTTGGLMSQMDSSVTLAEVISRIGTDGGEDLIGSATGSTLGGLTGGAPPPNVAILAHKRTARGGRRGRGRWYLPWYCSANDLGEDGVLLAAKLTAKQTALNATRAAMAAGGNPMVVLHRPGHTSPGPPDVVTNIVVANVVGTQRRRLGR
jgi:hypothetical protein